MRLVLRIAGIRVWLQHISDVANARADGISQEIGNAKKSAYRWDSPPKDWVEKYACTLACNNSSPEVEQVDGTVVEMKEMDIFLSGIHPIEALFRGQIHPIKFDVLLLRSRGQEQRTRQWVFDDECVS